MEEIRDPLGAKLLRWEKYMLGYSLPTWEELPDLELYMDQVVALVTRYMDILPQSNMAESVITPSTINNYVRMKVMPAPLRKKYTKIHLAYLNLICLLKQSLSLAEIQIVLPVDLPEAEVRNIYDNFVQLICSTSRMFTVQVREEAKNILDEKTEAAPGSGAELMQTAAVFSVLYRLLTTKLLSLRELVPAETEEKSAPAEENA